MRWGVRLSADGGHSTKFDEVRRMLHFVAFRTHLLFSQPYLIRLSSYGIASSTLPYSLPGGISHLSASPELKFLNEDIMIEKMDTDVSLSSEISFSHSDVGSQSVGLLTGRRDGAHKKKNEQRLLDVVVEDGQTNDILSEKSVPYCMFTTIGEFVIRGSLL